MLPTRPFTLLLVAVALLGPGPVGAGSTAPVVYLADAASDISTNGSVQQRTVGSKAVWMVAPGRPAPEGARALRAAKGESLYLVRDHDVPESGRTLAAWDGFRVVAVAPESARFHHCAEALGWLPPAPRPTSDRPTLARRTTPEQKAAIVDAVDLTAYTDHVRRLSGDLPTVEGDTSSVVATRWTGSDGAARGIDLATNYVTSAFESSGYTVIEQVFTLPGTSQPARNLLAIRPGVTRTDDVVVVGAHYDAVSENPAESAPGAEDNASGTAAVLELARAFADVDPELSIHFIAFGGEEQGLHGSRHYVSQLASEGWTVVGAYTMDMIAAWVDDFGVLIEGDFASQPLMETLESNVNSFTTMSSAFSFAPFGSDHIPFIQAGLPALLAIDLDWAAYDPYHTTADSFAMLDPVLGHEITRAIAGAVVDLAGTVDVVSVDDDVLPPPDRAPAFGLADPYPNPFNPRTVITFALPVEGPVSLQVHDARGRVVRRLVDEIRGADRASVVWDGTDAAGRAVASGLYFVRLEHEGRVQTRRAVLVR